MSTKITSHQFLSLLKNKDFEKAYTALETFSFESFENILHASLSKFNIADKEDVTTYFFNVYLPNSKYFIQLIYSPRRRELFNYLFSFPSIKCPNLYTKLIKEQPEFLIELIKRHQIPFLYKEHLFQISPKEMDDDLFEFCHFATMLSAFEIKYYQEAYLNLRKLKTYSLEEIFSLVGCWLNYFNWENIVNKNNADKGGAWNSRAIYAMNAMVDQIIAQRINEIEINGQDPLSFQRAIINSKDEAPPHFDVFLSWLRWQTFVKDFVEQFCFEDSAVIGINDKGEFTININDEAREKLEYFLKKGNYYETYISEDHKVHKTPEEFGTNADLIVKMMSPFLNKELRHLEDGYINKIYSKEFEIDSSILLSFLTTKMLTWKIWYSQKTLNGIKQKRNWKDILCEIDNCNIESFKGQLPFAETPEEIKINELVKKTSEKVGINKELLEKCRDVCTFNIDNYKPEKFNRFKPQINLMNFVWFKINKKYYSLLPIVCSLSMHSLIANLALIVNKTHNKNFKKEVEEMESIFSNNLNEKGIHAISSQEYTYNLNEEIFRGEIDAIIFDGKQILGIEFKRSSFRSTLVGANYEREVVLEEAARQLDRFKIAIKNTAEFKTKNLGLPSGIKLNTYHIEGLIITTNFEFDHEVIQGKYLKISWIEWLWLSENFENGDTIETLLRKVKENVFWETVIKI